MVYNKIINTAKENCQTESRHLHATYVWVIQDIPIRCKPAAVRWTEEVFYTFHSALMGKEPSQMDKLLEKYTGSSINGFYKCIKKDITPVKNAVSLEISSGFVEGNNNKFKLIKRIVYGRSKLANLSKKCFLAFMSKADGFE